jgi:CRP/FNR family transcriptional regulator, cyclic AMP receptor protein
MQTLESLQRLLAEHPFLTGLDPSLLHSFEECGSLRRFGPQQQIFHEGGQADHFYLILNGKVGLETFVPGCGMVTIQALGAGDALGWSWLFPPQEWHFTATTGEPTEVISFDAAALRAKAELDKDFANELITRVARTLVQRLQATRLQLIDFYGMRP